VIKGVEGATSRAASWVQLAYSAQAPWPSERWIEILDHEQKLLQQSSSETKLSLFVELTTWVAQQARLETGDKQIALRIASRIPPILLSSQPDPDKLVAFAEWALGADLPELVQEQYTQLPKQFPHTIPPILHYLLAESIARQGNKELADQIAKYALARKSVVLEQGKLIEAPESGSAPPVPQNRLQFRSINFDYERTLMAQLLINRGSFERAESELREVVKGQEDSPDSVFAISLRSLAMMLHEQDRDLEAAQALEKWVERYETEKLFRMQVDEYQMDLASNYYLYLANHLAKEGKSDQARESYFKAIALEPDNVDALIGLAKMSETPEEKQRRLAEQEKTISLMRNEIEAIDRDLRLANPMFQAAEKSKLANSLNTLAWLMINTECDPREALMLSRRSCGLSPNQSAYQDTLAHCLDKNGKHRDAFRTQIKALSLEPHQLSLQRALVRFYQKAIEETSATSK
jgi:tetratricopeptide (TPR) repeat protein